MKNTYKYFENTECKYYPCHEELKNINCLFCYCPFYFFNYCPGTYKRTEEGVKDCSLCIFPHQPENFEKVMDFIKYKINCKKL